MIRIATQSEIDSFIRDCHNDESIYPYLSTSKYICNIEETKTDWTGLVLTNDCVSVLLKVQIIRECDNELRISIYSKTPISAGRGMVAVKELAKRYNSRFITAVVHSSNVRSININKKIFGEPWGVEPLGAWNSKEGKWEDLLLFKKILW